MKSEAARLASLGLRPEQSLRSVFNTLCVSYESLRGLRLCSCRLQMQPRLLSASFRKGEPVRNSPARRGQGW